MTQAALAVEVVIVAHDAGELLADALTSAAEQAGAEAVWLVDAASTDGSVAAAARRVPGCHVISAPNEGFSAGNNRGIAQTRSEFVLLLNPDAMLLPRALDVLVATARAQPRAGIVGPLVLDSDGHVQAGSFGRFPTLGSAVELRAWRAVQRLRGNSGLSPRGLARAASVEWVTGAAMLVRRAAMDEVGPLDEGYFLYYEDLDWCHRMRDCGWDVILEPQAEVVHARGVATGKSALAQQAYRDSFRRYCDVYGLWALRGVSEVILAARRLVGGRR